MASFADLVAKHRFLVIFALTLTIGVGLGFAAPASAQYPQPWATASGIIGWTYFAAWSISFWPQVFINYKRKSVVGLSFDYVYLNILGFTCYSAYNLCYYWNPQIRADYAVVYGGLPGVQSNDVFFALHAVCLTVIVGVQCAIYERGGQTMSVPARLMLTVCFGFSVVYACIAGAYSGKVDPSDKRSWLSFLTALSYVKLAITLSKYAPQVFLNWKRKSTQGWSVENVLLDFTGGGLSVFQLVGDAWSIKDWSLISGDPVKLGLGNISMVFDIVFMIQHFALYKDKEAEDKSKYTAIPGHAEDA